MTRDRVRLARSGEAQPRQKMWIIHNGKAEPFRTEGGQAAMRN
jgi:hypothetical protein